MDPLFSQAGVRSPDTLDRIRRVLIFSLHLNLREEDLAYETKLDETVGLDSVAVLEFVAALEQEFGITFDPEMLTIEVVRDLSRLASYIDELLARRDIGKS
ncbi:MAG: acyl carrier protein [Bryobacteraceae bacterium]